MHFNLLFILNICAEIRLCVLPENTQAIKTYSQFLHYDKILGEYFPIDDRNCLRSIAGFDVYMLLEDKELVGYVQYFKSKAYSIKNRKEYIMISMYCFTITRNFNGKGFSYQLFDYSIKDLTKRYNLPDDALFTLHLSANDIKMPIASKIYYSLGFRKGIFIEHDPREMLYKLDELFEKSADMLDISNGKEEGYGKGYYFMLYCLLKDVSESKNNCYFKIENGEKLAAILKKKKSNKY